MIHLGDITKINGAEIPIVDVITGGSPCQDLSVAGKRAGLAGERSGLFMEQIRVIKEMREHDRRAGRTDEYIRPRYMVWENVPGAFSSGNPKGADFAAVIEEIIKVAEPRASVSVCIPNGGWTKSGCFYADDGSWSIAWRVHDAQFWGVPQRRKRIALVADFGGLSAPEILFERKGLSRDFEQSREAGKEIAGAVGCCVEGTGFGETGIGYWQNGIQTLRAEGENRPSRPSNVIVSVHATQDPVVGNDMSPCISQGSVNGMATVAVLCLQGNGIDRADTAKCNGRGWGEDVSYTLNTIDRHAVYDARGNGDGEIAPTLIGDHQNRVTDYTALCVGNGQLNNMSMAEQANTLDTMHDQQAVMVCTEGVNNAETRNQILRLLQENYGEEKVLKWGIAILEQLQQTDILQQGVHESIISEETEKWNELDDCALPCPELVAGWMLRDLWEQQECGCSPQGWGSTEQQFGQFAEGLPKLSQQNSQACKDLFDMWQKGEGLWLLREALSEIQKIWKSLNGQRQSVCGHSIVRRLTPLEAERLQGYPDGWTDIGEWVDSKGKKHKDTDSPRYKALGNSIALPFWEWLARRIAAQYERHITLGSLFDGISGFCLVFARAGCKPVFSSEIEEYPIAVAKKHFGDDDLGLEGDYERYL